MHARLLEQKADLGVLILEAFPAPASDSWLEEVAAHACEAIVTLKYSVPGNTEISVS